MSAPPFCTLTLKIIPNAPRNEIIGRLGDAIKIKVQAPPVNGRANDMLCDFIAERLALPRRSVTLMRGDSSRQKVVRIEGLSAANVHSRLGL